MKTKTIKKAYGIYAEEKFMKNIKKLAKKYGRSFSSQIIYMLSVYNHEHPD